MSLLKSLIVVGSEYIHCKNVVVISTLAMGIYISCIFNEGSVITSTIIGSKEFWEYNDSC